MHRGAKMSSMQSLCGDVTLALSLSKRQNERHQTRTFRLNLPFFFINLYFTETVGVCRTDVDRRDESVQSAREKRGTDGSRSNMDATEAFASSVRHQMQKMDGGHGALPLLLLSGHLHGFVGMRASFGDDRVRCCCQRLRTFHPLTRTSVEAIVLLGQSQIGRSR